MSPLTKALLNRAPMETIPLRMPLPAVPAAAYAQTNSGSQPWWQVDLGKVNIVDSIYTVSPTGITADTGYDIKYSLDNQNWEICAYEHYAMGAPAYIRSRTGFMPGTSASSSAETAAWVCPR